MDFDKQFGTKASNEVMRRGRGFTEKPMAQHNPVQRQNHTLSTHKKVTRNTQLYRGISICA